MATATVSGQTLTIAAVAVDPGNVTITAMADDGNGATASTSFTVSVPTAVAVEDGDTGLPTTFALAPNYPNPFNPETRIRFGLPQSSEVRLAVFDVLGREVAVLVEERLTAGRHDAVAQVGSRRALALQGMMWLLGLRGRVPFQQGFFCSDSQHHRPNTSKRQIIRSGGSARGKGYDVVDVKGSRLSLLRKPAILTAMVRPCDIYSSTSSFSVSMSRRWSPLKGRRR